MKNVQICRELLEQIADFEERELSLSGASSDFSLAKNKLEPLNEVTGADLLKKEIERLREENQKLSERSKSLEVHVTHTLQSNELLQKQIKELGAKPAVVTVSAIQTPLYVI